MNGVFFFFIKIPKIPEHTQTQIPAQKQRQIRMEYHDNCLPNNINHPKTSDLDHVYFYSSTLASTSLHKAPLTGTNLIFLLANK